MNELFKEIEYLIPRLPGWCDVEKANVMANLVLGLRPKISAELGVYGGRSFFPMAMAHKHLAYGTCIGIDPWSNEAATEGYTGANKEVWKNDDLERIFNMFDKTRIELGVGNVTQIHRKKSDDVEPPKFIGLLHVDGQHTEQAVRDVQRYASNVLIGGICVMDDLGWSNDGDQPVLRAVSELENLGFIELYKLGTGAVFQRVKP